MQITFVEMINFMSYVQERIHFTPGMNAIVGPVGVGKSSIRDAVSLVLFNKPTGKLSVLLREGAKSATVTVGLVSSLDEHHYEIERRFTKTTTTRYGVYDADAGRQCIAQGVSDVEEWVREHLGIPADANLGALFEATIGVPQGMFTAPFLLAPSQRRVFFDRVLDTDSYKVASDHLLPAVRMLSDQAASHRTEMAHLEGMLSGLPALQKEDKVLKGEINGLAEQDASDRQALIFADEKFKKLNEAQQAEKEADRALADEKTRCQAHESIIQNLRAAFLGACYAGDRLRDNLAAHTAYERADSRLQDLNLSRRCRDDLLQAQRHARSQLAALTAAKAILPDAQQRATGITARVGQIEAELVEASHLQEAIDATRVQIQQDRDLVDQYQATQGALRADINEAERQRRFLGDKQNAACPTCGSALSPGRRTALLERNSALLQTKRPKHAEVAKQIIRASHQIAVLQQSQGETQDKLRTLASHRDLIRATQNLKAEQEAVARLQEQIADAGDAERAARGFDVALAPFADLDNQLSHFQDQRSEHQAAHNTYMSNLTLAGELNKREDAYNEAQLERSRLEQRYKDASLAYVVAAAGYNAMSHVNVQREVRMLRSALATTKAQITLKRERLTVVKKSLVYLETAQVSLDKVTTELQATEETHATIQWGRELLREAGPLVTRRLLRQISHQASSIYADLLGQSGRRLEWSEDYELSLEYHGYRRPFSQFSGGQKMLAVLAIRWALLTLTSAIDIAFYDEPTENLDAPCRQAVAAAIGRLRGAKQLFVMSHWNAFEADAVNCVRIILDDRGSHVLA